MVYTHWGIPEALDGLENATSYRSHGEGTSTVIYDPPGTAKKHKDGSAVFHHDPLWHIHRYGALLLETPHPSRCHRTQKQHEEANLPTSLLHPQLLSITTNRGNTAAKPAQKRLPACPPAAGSTECLNSSHVAQRWTSITENLCRTPAYNQLCPNYILGL